MISLNRIAKGTLVGFLVAALSGCAGALSFKTPVSGTRPRYVVVSPDESLAAIAWTYGLRYHQLARWNHIAPPYRLHPGQRLTLYPPGTSAQKAPRSSFAQVASRPNTETFGLNQPHRLKWSWPAKGTMVRSFGKSGYGSKGILIKGHLGEPIRASAGGTVVYAGGALKRYGLLVIIKYNDTWLSAYGHNRKLLVHQGQHVQSGQRIATMGTLPDGVPGLYFQIRKNGKPVNPLPFLSKPR